MTVRDFHNELLKFMIASNQNTRLYDFTDEDIVQIGKLVKEKYTTWEWNFGYSPKYGFERLIRTKDGSIEVQMNIEKGIIQNIKIHGDFLNEPEISELEQKLIGQKHQESSIRSTLSQIPFEKFFPNTSMEELIPAMF